MRVFLLPFIKLIIILFIILGLTLALLPTLANTNWGRNQLVSWVNQSIPGNIEIRNLDLHWGKGQIIEGILLKDPEGQSVLGIEKISTDATLWQLLAKKADLGITLVQELNAAIVTDKKGWTNLQRALGIPPSKDLPPLSPSTIILSDVNAKLDLFSADQPISAHITGLTRQDNLKGSFEAIFSLTGLQKVSNWNQLKEEIQRYVSVEGSKEAKIQVKVVNFPVDLIDRLIALKISHLNGLFHSILGDHLNLIIDKEPSNNGLAFNLTALSPLMQGDIKGKFIQEGILILSEPANFHFQLTPEFINPFTHHQFELLDFSRLQIVLSDLSLPLNFFDNQAQVDPCLFTFKAECNLSETKLDISSIGKIDIQNLYINADSPACDSLIRVQVEGQAKQNREPFEIHFNSTLKKPKNFSFLSQQIHKSLFASLKISHLPLQLIPFLQEHKDWREQIGSFADAEVILSSKEKEEWEAQINLKTPNFILKEARFHIAKEVTLQAPTQVEWLLAPNCLNSLLHSQAFSLDQICHLQLNLKQLQIPLSSPSFSNYQLESKIPELQFSNLLSGNIINIQNLLLKVEGQDLNHLTTSLNGQLALLNQNLMHSPLLQEPLHLMQTSNWKIGNNGKIKMSLGLLEIKNSLAQIRLEGRLKDLQELELTQPAQIHYLLTPAAWLAINQLLAKDWPKLQEDSSLKLTINPTSLKLKSWSLSDLNLQGILAIDHIVLQDDSRVLPIMENITIPWVIDDTNNDFYANFKSSLYLTKNTAPGQVEAFIQLWPMFKQFDAEHTQAEINVNVAVMPTSTLNLLLNTPDLSPILGPIIDFNLKTFYDPTHKKSGYWVLKLDSQQFHIDGRFKLNHSLALIDSTKPSIARLTITPESYQHIKKLLAIQDDRELAAPVNLQGTLTHIDFPLRDFASKPNQFNCQFLTTDIQWQNSTLPPIKLEGEVNSSNLLEQIQFSASIHSSKPSLQLQGILTNVFNQQRKMRNWQEIGINAHLQGQKLAPTMFESLFLLNGEQTQKLTALLGDSFELNSSCQIQNLSGPLQAKAKGSQGELDFDGYLKQGILKLNQPLKGSLKMTPLFSQAFLAKNIPLLSSAIGADNPITFTIEPSQFSCPLVPFKLEEVKIDKGTLDLGKIRFRNDGELNSFLGLIHTISDPYLTIWFTPLYFQLDQGILDLKRVDLLIANTYTLASWGKINLTQHIADLIVGLSAQSLQYAFGIQGIDEHYLLQIPLHSEKGKVQIDKKRATGRISALIAQSQAGKTGKILGNLLDLALSSSNEVAPPPTTQPFPWGDRFAPSPSTQEPYTSSSLNPPDSSSLQDQDSSKEKKKKKKKSKRDKEKKSNSAIKEIQEGAIQLLDQLFNSPS